MNNQRYEMFVVALALIGVITTIGLPEAGYAVQWQTESDSSVINAASPAADTVALDTGQVSVSFQSTAGGDTRWSDTATDLTTEVDTGFDIWDVDSSLGTTLSDSLTFKTGFPGTVEGSDTYSDEMSPGDSRVISLNVHNLSNNARPISFSSNYFMNDGSLNGDTFTVDFYVHNGDSTADTFDPNASDVTKISGNDTPSIFFDVNEIKTFFLVATAADTAEDGDSETTEFFVTDNAPIHGGDISSSSGDGWERGNPISSDDTYDTQQIWLIGSVIGPDISLSKSFTGVSEDASGDSLYRPGDTVVFTITVQNNGADTAEQVRVTDAIPDNTTYDTATFVNLNGNATDKFSDGIGYSTSNNNDLNFQDSEPAPANVERVMWAIDQIGPSGQPNDTVTAEMRVIID